MNEKIANPPDTPNPTERTAILQVRLTADDKALIEEAALHAQRSVSSFVRISMLAASCAEMGD